MLAILLSVVLAVGAAFIKRPWLSRIVLPSATGFLGLTIAQVGVPILALLFHQIGEVGEVEFLLVFLTGWALAWGIGVTAGAWLGLVLRERASGRRTDEELASSARWALVVFVVMAVPVSILVMRLSTLEPDWMTGVAFLVAVQAVLLLTLGLGLRAFKPATASGWEKSWALLAGLEIAASILLAAIVMAGGLPGDAIAYGLTLATVPVSLLLLWVNVLVGNVSPPQQAAVKEGAEAVSREGPPPRPRRSFFSGATRPPFP